MINKKMNIKNKLKIPPKKNIFQIKKYFKDYNILHFFKDPIFEKKRHIKKLLNLKSIETYSPELYDLYFLHAFIILNKRLTIMEFGSGWSSLVMAHALMINKQKFSKDTDNLRKKNIFELHSIENEKKYLKISKLRTLKYLKDFKKNINSHFSNCKMTIFNGRFCTEYEKLPLINPDLIYLDGPDQFKVNNRINNFTINHEDMMPMVSDILKIENFLIPGTAIIVDGRNANCSFLKNNFQRKWIFKNFIDDDRTLIYLNDDSLGRINNQLLKFYKSK